MYPLGFTGLIECRLLNIFEPGVCPVWIMCNVKGFIVKVDICLEIVLFGYVIKSTAIQP